MCTRPSATVPTPLPLLEFRTCYHRRSRHCRHCRLSSVHWRRNCFADRTTTHTSGNNSIDTSLIRDIYCGPEVLFWDFVSPWNMWMMMVMIMMMMMMMMNLRVWQTDEQADRMSTARARPNRFTLKCCRFRGEYYSESIFFKLTNICQSYERMYSGTVFWLTMYKRQCVVDKTSSEQNAVCLVQEEYNIQYSVCTSDKSIIIRKSTW